MEDQQELLFSDLLQKSIDSCTKEDTDLSPEEYKQLTELLKDESNFTIYYHQIMKEMISSRDKEVQNIYEQIGKPQINVPCPPHLEFRPVSEFSNGSKFFGQWNKHTGWVEGQGIHINTNGQLLLSTWENDSPNGEGLVIYKNGSFYYKGHYKDFKRDGTGTYVSSSGYKYVGQWKDGKANGFGVETFASGAKYEGEFLDDAKHEKGIYYRPDGTTEDGEFINDKTTGYIYSNMANGDQYFGFYKNNIKYGVGAILRADGTKMEGTWSDGEIKTGIYTDSKGREYLLTGDPSDFLQKSKFYN